MNFISLIGYIFRIGSILLQENLVAQSKISIMAITDAFRERLAKQQVSSKEEKKKQRRSLLIPNVIALVLLYFPMVIIGYRNNGLCEMDAPLYLLIGGGVGLFMTIMKLIAILTPSECDDKFVNGLMPVAIIFDFGVMIWGSIVVFGAYSSWSYDENDKDKNEDEYSYCPYTPFMTAFVLLILEWVLKPCLALCECFLAVIGCCFKGGAADSATEYAAAETSDNAEKGAAIIKQPTSEKN